MENCTYCGKCELFKRLYSSPCFGLCVADKRAKQSMDMRGRLPVAWEFDKCCEHYEPRLHYTDFEWRASDKYYSTYVDSNTMAFLENPAPKGLRAFLKRLLDKRCKALHAPQGR